jgi:gamma-aminobutyric acid type B receptor
MKALNLFGTVGVVLLGLVAVTVCAGEVVAVQARSEVSDGGRRRDVVTTSTPAAAAASVSSSAGETLLPSSAPLQLQQQPRPLISFVLLNGVSDFFTPVLTGWNRTCQQLLGSDVVCSAITPKQNDTCSERVQVLRDYLRRNVSGIAMAPCADDNNYVTGGSGSSSSSSEISRASVLEFLDEAQAAGVPVVLFDTDLPNSSRAAYVGTDQTFLGRTLARMLRALHPNGGTYAILGYEEGRVEGFVEEITKYNDQRDRAHWYEIQQDFALEGIQSNDYMKQMELYAVLNPTAMVAMLQTPMRHPNWTTFVDANRYRNITYIGTDGADYQLQYLQELYVDGLVGQVPFQIGKVAVQTLYDLVITSTSATMKKDTSALRNDIVSTNVVSYTLFPAELPTSEIDQNLLGNLRYIGLSFFVIAALTAVSCMTWTWFHRRDVVVMAAQPYFLLMVAGGVLILCSSLVPLSLDDNGTLPISNVRSIGICMSIPWLACTGFTITFSALFSKTWRVNRLLHSTVQHARIIVSEKDALAPFAIVLTLNIVVLLCWTLIDALRYVRRDNDGLDYYSRVISSYGSCRSEHTYFYLVPLACINVGVIATACYQAFQAWDIQLEFSESTYIAIAVASLFQAFVTGIPVVAVVKDMPTAYYLLLSLMIFLVSMAILLLIFLPKIILQKSYSLRSEASQKKMLKARVAEQTGSRFTQSIRHRIALPSNCAAVSDPAEQGAGNTMTVSSVENSQVMAQDPSESDVLSQQQAPISATAEQTSAFEFTCISEEKEEETGSDTESKTKEHASSPPCPQSDHKVDSEL